MWPTILTVRKPESFCLLEFRALCVAAGRLDGSISYSRLRGIKAPIVFAPYTLEILSFVLGFEFVENATVFLLRSVSCYRIDPVLLRLPFRHKIARSELDAHTNAGIRIEKLQHLVVLPLDILLQLLSSHRKIVE
jgi:hypothetical protein